MAHSHYVLDLYFPSGGAPDATRRDVMRIEAANDSEAIEEADRISGWRQPIRYEIRAITKATRTGDRLVHASVVTPELPDGEEAAEEEDDTAQPPDDAPDLADVERPLQDVPT